MNQVDLYLAIKYNPTTDVGAYSFIARCAGFEKPELIQYQTYSKTSGPRMEMIACLEAVNMIARKYGRETLVSIHSKQEVIIKALKRGGTKKSGANSNEDLYNRGAIELKQVSIIVIEKEKLDRKGLFQAEHLCEIAFREEPLLVDVNEEEERKPKPLF